MRHTTWSRPKEREVRSRRDVLSSFQQSAHTHKHQYWNNKSSNNTAKSQHAATTAAAAAASSREAVLLLMEWIFDLFFLSNTRTIIFSFFVLFVSLACLLAHSLASLFVNVCSFYFVSSFQQPIHHSRIVIILFCVVCVTFRFAVLLRLPLSCFDHIASFVFSSSLCMGIILSRKNLRKKNVRANGGQKKIDPINETNRKQNAIETNSI